MKMKLPFIKQGLLIIKLWFLLTSQHESLGSKGSLVIHQNAAVSLTVQIVSLFIIYFLFYYTIWF